ncbi:polysaccharide deacetylase [Stutzerimonas stutzeri]|uniref:Polysaccharide deacetylase n=3 Tax=Pseudomonadales TaxID=72274 RepID=A0A0D9AFV0_STUST|nr:polysaccharide deacetylase [Stutzerimonas stutzeri]
MPKVVRLLLGILAPLLMVVMASVEAGDIEGADDLAVVARMPKLALVIDDLGQNAARDRRVLALPGPVAMAILPDTRHATKLAEQARTAGKTVMLHLPMAPAGGPYAWQPQLPQAELDRRLDSALAKVPHSSGVNNHMGSQMTDRQRPMTALMSELQERHLFFLDSRTNAGTVAAAAAQKIGLASLSRDIFLDDDPSPKAVAEQFRAAIQLARKQGSVVVIGHPHPATLALLERELPKLGAQGIDWVNIDQMIATRGNRAMIAHGANGLYR